MGNNLYGWSESREGKLLNAGIGTECYLTSLAFSSSEGCKAILAFGRSNGTLGLMSLYDDPVPEGSHVGPLPRFEVIQPSPVSCLSWRPVCTLRPSKDRLHLGTPVKTEDLLVGDDAGHVYYYAVEWPERWEVTRHNWCGDVTLLARIAVHSQRICGLAWSRNGELFATGANDNQCCLFEASRVLEPSARDSYLTMQRRVERSTAALTRVASEASEAETLLRVPQNSSQPVKHLGLGSEKHRWLHRAAVKAIAFCPWQESLVATGGGTNDKCIHFFHTTSGAALATISVSAQVTSLIWSNTRREIAATFGYAQPQHPIRIAVFTWPGCRQVAAMAWASEHRALYAISYPHVPGGEKSSRPCKRLRTRRRAAMEGCIIVASSDKRVQFHEVWATDGKGAATALGIRGGSDIWECVDDMDIEGGVIR